MNIVIFDDLPEGGAKRVVFEHVKRLSENHTVYYITNTIHSSFPFAQFAHDIFVFDLDMKPYRGYTRIFQELSLYNLVIPTYRKICTLINQIDPDVVLIHPSRITQAPLLLTMLDRKTIYFAEEWLRLVYEPDLHPLPFGFKGLYEKIRRSWLGYLDLQAVKSAYTVITTSRFVQKQYQETYMTDSVRIPLGVSDEFCEDHQTVLGDYFLFIGEKESINGYPLLVEALRYMNKKPTIKYITFSGKSFRYSDKQLAALYQGAIASLCLAPHEPFGLVALESMACGTPVIAIQDGGYTDTVIDKKTGYLCKPDPISLAHSIELLSNDAVLRARLGNNARRHVSVNFSWEQHILALEKVFAKVL